MNIAERLQQELESLDVMIGDPIMVKEGGKVGPIGKPPRQYNINPSYNNINKGPASEFSGKETPFDEEVIIKELAKRIANDCGNKIRFIELILPIAAVHKAEMIKTDKVLVRFLEDFLPTLNKSMPRYDVLIDY